MKVLTLIKRVLISSSCAIFDLSSLMTSSSFWIRLESLKIQENPGRHRKYYCGNTRNCELIRMFDNVCTKLILFIYN